MIMKPYQRKKFHIFMKKYFFTLFGSSKNFFFAPYSGNQKPYQDHLGIKKAYKYSIYNNR